MDDLIDICISPQQNTPEIKVIGQTNQFSFSSPSADFRFLGGFMKENLSEEDLRQCKVGGMPEKAIMLFVGYGGGAINVLRVGNRLILNNGFHRVYALRQKNITEIPVVIQNIGNPNLDLPQITPGIPNGYFLQTPRPIVTKDFFNSDLVETLEVKDTITNVRVNWNSDGSFVPV